MRKEGQKKIENQEQAKGMQKNIEEKNISTYCFLYPRKAPMVATKGKSYYNNEIKV